MAKPMKAWFKAGVIDATELAANSVGTSELSAASVTNAKLANPNHYFVVGPFVAAGTASDGDRIGTFGMPVDATFVGLYVNLSTVMTAQSAVFDCHILSNASSSAASANSVFGTGSKLNVPSTVDAFETRSGVSSGTLTTASAGNVVLIDVHEAGSTAGGITAYALFKVAHV